MKDKPKALVTVKDPYLKRIIFPIETVRRLENIADVDWIDENGTYDSARLAEDSSRYDIILTSWGSPKLTTEVIAQARRLRFVGHAAGTVIPIVDPEIFDHNIVVANANRALAMSTAELTLSLMLAASWNLPGYSARLKEGEWSKNYQETVKGLGGATIGLIGFGEISMALIHLLKPLDVTIKMVSQHCSPAKAIELGIELVPLNDLLQSCDIVSIHSTLTPQTLGLIGANELELMRDGTLLVNTARAAIIDSEALYSHLRRGRISAALDVFEREPLGPDDELLNMPNVLCVPHIGGFSSHWKTQLGLLVVEDLERHLRGEQVVGMVTRDKFERLSRF